MGWLVAPVAGQSTATGIEFGQPLVTNFVAVGGIRRRRRPDPAAGLVASAGGQRWRAGLRRAGRAWPGGGSRERERAAGRQHRESTGGGMREGEPGLKPGRERGSWGGREAEQMREGGRDGEVRDREGEPGLGGDRVEGNQEGGKSGGRWRPALPSSQSGLLHPIQIYGEPRARSPSRWGLVPGAELV
ncbi:hypothetical protein BRADI_4g11833v3 [Brachypodium distachyon]|uniref:Uncharacterized protein n=1 Tax=Brachypodium distachyon TaxID=15368 RepID=A0A2K2CM81_BRADI|nr:hypothetical protein BRADI_4g11833v3 [Brachypodium distachyon]